MPIFNVDVTADPHRPRVVGPDHAPVPAINDFLSYLEQRARSPYTVRAYARGLAHFAGWLHEAGVDLDAVTRPVVGQYIGAFGQGPRRHASLIDPRRRTKAVKRGPSIIVSASWRRTSRFGSDRTMTVVTAPGTNTRTRCPHPTTKWCPTGSPVVINPSASGGESFAAACPDAFRLDSIRSSLNA